MMHRSSTHACFRAPQNVPVIKNQIVQNLFFFEVAILAKFEMPTDQSNTEETEKRLPVSSSAS